MMKNDEIALVVNTVEEKRTAIPDCYQIRRRGAGRPRHLLHDAGRARAAAALGIAGDRELVAVSLQELHERLH